MPVASNGAQEDEVISEINITPFVDVVLVLLVIFMATAGILVNRGFFIELPQAQTTERITAPTPLQITVTRNGDIVVDKKVMSIDELQRVGMELLKKQGGVSVMIAADKGVLYKEVITLMDELRKIGVADFALQLDKIPEK